MKTILELYNESNVPSYESFVGKKVRVVQYIEGKESWSDTVHTIEKFIDNACGDGCCQAFEVSGFKNTLFWSSQLRQP
jgi:hypothetical protein